MASPPRRALRRGRRAARAGAARSRRDRDPRGRIRRELDNLRAAVTWALDRDDRADAELGVAIVAALHDQANTDIGSGIGAWAERAVPHARSSIPARRRAVLGAAAYTALQVRVDAEAGRSLALDAVTDSLTDEPPMSIIADIALASSYGYAGEVDAMRTHLAGVHATLDALGDHPYEQSILHSTTSTLLNMIGDRDGARWAADESLRIARRLQNPTALGFALFAVGFAGVDDDPDVALAALDESIALTRAGGYDAAFGTTLSAAAAIRARKGDTLGALRDLRDAVVHSSEVGDPMNFSTAIATGAVIATLAGRHDLAAVLGGFSEDSPTGLIARRQVGEQELAGLQQSQRETEEVLGTAEFATARARGAAMDPDQLTIYVRDTTDRILAGEEVG